MGVRRGHRAPTRYRPGNVFFSAGMLLIFAFGMALAAITETYLERDWMWFWSFGGFAAGCVVLYFWIVAAWLLWLTPLSGDYNGVDGNVDCGHDREHHHPGEP